MLAGAVQSRRALAGGVRAVVGFGVLGYLLSRLDLGSMIAALSDLALIPLTLALVTQAVAKLVWTGRWRDILRAAGLEIGFTELLRVLFIGLFFNSFLPTMVGGDVVRGYYAARGKQQLVTSYLVVLIERALGLITLAAVAGLACAAALASGFGALPRRFLLAVALVSGSIVVVGVTGFLCRGWRRLLRLREGRLAELADALDLFRRPATPRLRIVLLSLLLQVLGILFHIACARAVGLATPALVFFLVVPAALVAAMLPVTVNGLGIREGLLVGLLAAWGAPAATAGAFAILALVVASLFAASGGIIYALHRRRPGNAEITA